MKSLVLACLFIFIQSCADSNFLDRSKKDASILQGTEVAPRQFLSENVVMIAQDLVFQDNQPLFFGLCTGVIINERIVMTAAHCLDKGIKNMKVILNPNPRKQFSNREDTYSVVDYRIHDTYAFMKKMFPAPDLDRNFDRSTTFDFAKTYSDLAVITVDRDFSTDPKSLEEDLLSPVTSEFQKVTVAGFGKTSALRDTTRIDYKQINGVLKQATIDMTYENKKANVFSLPQWKKSGVCKGDSGAPVFVTDDGKNKLFAMAIGVFAREDDLHTMVDVNNLYDECASFGVYLNLEPLKPWLEKSIAYLKERQQQFQKPIRAKN